jgi:assimilatory nitrate reductase catalytic subunit
MDAAVQLDIVDTHCPYCALQCGMSVVRDGETWKVESRDFPTNKGGLCRKGWTAASLLDAPDRLTTPLIRDKRTESFRPASFDEALSVIAERFRRIQSTYGRDAVAVFGGGGLTNEKAYLLGKFARVALGTANIDYNGRFCMGSGANGNLRAFGIDRGLPFPLDDIPGAEVILLAGGNPAATMPPVMQYFEAQRRRGGKLIVPDPRRTETASVADLHLQLLPGTDAALANGLLHVAIRDKLLDEHFIKTRTSGFQAARRVCASFWPDRVERITGVAAADIERAAHMMGEAATAMVLSARGTEQQSNGTDNVQAFINLLLALGRAGKVSCGYGCLTGQGNGQGGREHGQKTDQLPGYRKLADPAHREAVARIWGVDPASLPMPGLPAVELFQALGRSVHGLLVMASNIVVSAPHSNQLAERLSDLDTLVVADMFLSETASRADVVLPITQWAEEEGTVTNLEGRVLRRRQVKAPPPGVWTDNRILHDLAARLGSSARFDVTARGAFEELRRASAGGTADYAGISYDRIEAENGVFWPCPSEGHRGTPRLFLDRFATPDGRALFYPVQYRGGAEQPDDDYPFFLTTGRVLSHYQTGAQTRRVPELAAAEPDAFVEMHPDAARGYGIRNGDQVRLSSRRGQIVVRARLSRDIRADVLFVPFHWGGEATANKLTNPVLDPVSRIPEFKVCAARIDALPANSPQKQNEVS